MREITEPDAAPAPGTATAPDTARLPGTARQRLLVAAGLMTAVLGVGAYAVIALTSGSAGANRGHALSVVRDADRQLQAAIQEFRSRTAACGQRLPCITALDGQVAKAFTSFGNSLRAAGVPTHFGAEANVLAADTGKAATDFSELGAAGSASRYMGVEAGLGLPATLNNWQVAFGQLVTQLNDGR